MTEFHKILNHIQDVCVYSSRNLILLNVNTPIVTNIICSHLKLSGLNLCVPLLNDITHFESLGGFLRSRTVSDYDSILVLDFNDKLGEITNIPNIINTNRDLFTDFFRSTIILASSDLIYNIRTYAKDFLSCVEVFADTTKWFFSPITLPVVKIRTQVNSFSLLANFFQKDLGLFQQFISIQNELQSIETYNQNIFYSLFQKINHFPNGLGKFKLFYEYGKKLINVRTRRVLFDERLEDVRKLVRIIPVEFEYVDTILLCAEFFYKTGQYQDAILCYQRTQQFLYNSWGDENKNTVLNFISCNIVVCKYVQEANHKPLHLLGELKERLFVNYNGLPAKYRELISNYLFLVDCICQHHSYAQHKDIYSRINTNTLCKVPMIDFTESQKIYYLWEQFISDNFKPNMIKTENRITTELYWRIQRMIYFFCQGKYKKAQQICKMAMSKCVVSGNIQVYDMINSFNRNMIALQKQENLLRDLSFNND